MSCSTLPNLSLQLDFAKKWTSVSLRPRTSTCCTCQERSTLEPKKKRDGKSRGEKNRSVTEDKSLISRSRISQQNSLPPLIGALKASAEKNSASFHFPGHNRGRAAPSSLTQLIGVRPFIHDLPELPELDNLFSPEGPILEAQMQAAKLFGSSETWFLVGGTTCGIQAAIMATCSPGEHIILPRNSHISAISAMVLSGAIPKYILPEYDCKWDIAGGVTPSQVGKAIKELQMDGKKPAAVFITSPTYHGICSDLSDISQLCHAYGIPVIVDEAHGAHLGFHPQMPHSALKQGADLVMLPELNLVKTQEQFSTKPLELASEASTIIKTIPGISVLDLSSFNEFPAIDPLRLTLGFWSLGLSGYEADDILDRDHGVISELVGTQSITFAINLGTCREHTQRLVSGLKKLSMSFLHSKTTEMRVESREHAPFNDICISLNPRDAFFANKRSVSIKESLGKVCGELISPYPPGIPVIIPGEVITEKALNYLLDVRKKGAVITGASDSHLSSIVICDVGRNYKFRLQGSDKTLAVGALLRRLEIVGCCVRTVM
ncbi:ARGININE DECARBOXYLASE [Salix viminalis]|uniref:ARGININE DECARBOXYLASE n=1 Tax=Salix viminalis TaxID=40686 RepID=A0A9Q0NNQ6_SALVM|nr:ARGININE DECARBOXYLASE [Salix viminalis]